MNANHNEASIDEAIANGNSAAAPKTGCGSRLASGTVGAGTVGVLGLLGGFWTPLAGLAFLMMGMGAKTATGAETRKTRFFFKR